MPPLAFSDEKFFVSAGGTLDTGTLREMWPHESALVSPLSSRYGARDTVAAATRLCAGGLGGFVVGRGGGVVSRPKIADFEEMVGSTTGFVFA